MPHDEFITGIPDRLDQGDLSQLKAKQLVDWIIQRHDAARAKRHFDLRFGTPDTGLYSWATRKELPEPGQKILAVRQPLHSHEYKDFEGEIESGYGKGTVAKHDEGKVLITKVEPNKIHMTVAHRRYPERYVLFKPEGGIGKKEDNWLLMNTTPRDPLKYPKLHYKSVPQNKIEPLLDKLQPGSSVQAKIDGALTLTQLLKDKIELLSYRTSKAHGGPLPHTEKVFKTIPNIEVPKQYQGSVLNGELYATQDNKPLNPQALGGLLNSSLAKALTDQEAQGVSYKNQLFDVRQLGKKPVSNTTHSYAERMQAIKDMLASLKGPDAEAVRQVYHTPEEAKTPEAAKNLYKTIVEGKHPSTVEGIVVHPEYGTPLKSKLFDEFDVRIRGMFPGKGKYKDRGVGGFVYSDPEHGEKGPILGEVGTGFSDQLREAMFGDPSAYMGRTARVRATKRLPSGALFQPSLIALHESS